MWNQSIPKNKCFICGRGNPYEDKDNKSKRCEGENKPLCDKWLENNKMDIANQQIKNLEERMKVGLPPLEELMILNRRGLYLGLGEFVYHPETDTFYRCFLSGEIPLLQSESWENVNKERISTYYSQYKAELKDILKKRLFEEKNKGEWPAEPQVNPNISPAEFSEIEYESVPGFKEDGPFDVKHAGAIIN